MARPVESFVTAGPVMPTVLEHGLPRYFASDEALIDILDRYPHDLFDINQYAFDAEGQVSLTTGSRGRADGRAVLEAIRAGRLWVNLRSCEEAHPGLWAEVLRSFGDLAPGRRMALAVVTTPSISSTNSPVAKRRRGATSPRDG